MKILELFSGTESFSKVARERGHEVFTVDNKLEFNPDLCKDILDLKPGDIPFKPDIIWASPPCQGFSVATIGRNWNKNHTPKTDLAQLSIDLVCKTLQLINNFMPKYYFIENPRGKLRKMHFMSVKNRKTVTYCQYGDNRMKPTDIWTNNEGWKPRLMCKPRANCHISAPRGSKTGTQGLKNSIERGIVPRELCEDIIKICEVEE